MKKKLYLIASLFVALSMLLGACGGAATQAPVATEAVPAATEAPVVTQAPATEAPVVTEAPPVEVAPPDFATLFTSVIGGMVPDKGYGTVKPATLSEELADKPPFILDVRETAELEAEGYIEGAVNIPFRDLMKNLDKLPGLDDPIVIYCASGHRGGMAFSALQLLGYTNVRNLAGGLGAWKKANLPVVTGSLPEVAAAISTPIVADQALFTTLDTFISDQPENFYTVKNTALNESIVAGLAPFILDIRTTEEFAKDGYVEGAVNIPLDQVLSNLDKLPKDQPIAVYCVSGHRASVATMVLKLLGYDASNIAGGLNAWKAADLPVVGWVNWPKVWNAYLAALPQDYSTVTADALNVELAEANPPFMVDVREPTELEADGYIEGAVNIPVRELLKNLDKLPAQAQPIVVYCASGHRGGMAMAALQLLGYTNVRNLAGGLGAWKKAEFPLVTGIPATPSAGSAPETDVTRLRDLDAFFSGMADNFYAVKAPDLNTELVGGEALTIIDVRRTEEFSEGHIEGAINIPLIELLVDLSKLPADKATKIVVHCVSGHRASLATIALRMLGYTEVRNLAGGMNAWTAAELPVVK